MYLKASKVVTPDGIIENGCIRVDGEKITSVGKSSEAQISDKEEISDFPGAILCPGFIDIHVHGAGRHNASGGHIKDVANFVIQSGTTAFLPTLASATGEKYLAHVRETRSLCDWDGEGALVMGSHVEGPYINPEAKGGMAEEFLRIPDESEYVPLIKEGKGAVKIMTLSPELPGSIELMRFLEANGVVSSVGHSKATEDGMKEAIEAGLTHTCHLFNALSYGDDKEPGVSKVTTSEICLAEEALSVELICDKVHVDPVLIGLALKTKGAGKTVAITDALQGAGMPDGEYVMSDGRRTVIRNGEAIRLKDSGLLVGSALTMNVAVGNLVEMGVPLVDAMKMASLAPARVIHMDDVMGSIEEGKEANVTVLDKHFDCMMSMIRGRIVHSKNSPKI